MTHPGGMPPEFAREMTPAVLASALALSKTIPHP